MYDNLTERLAQGDFSQVELDEWFEYMHHCQKYSAYIYATIEGCKKQINPQMVSLILMYAKQFYFKTKDLTVSNNIIINSFCEEFLKKLVIISQEEPQYKYIIRELSVFPNDIIRLYYCAYIDHREYLNDSSPRIKKVANIINDFNTIKLKEIYENHSHDQLDFLTYAIQYGAIQMKSLYTPQKNDEVTGIQFKSMLFNWNNEEINPNLFNFDIDILETIPNKKILAYIVLDWINNGTISFKEEMTPKCFKQTDENSLKKTLKPNN